MLIWNTRALWLMAIIALIGAAGVLLRAPSPRPDRTIWLFSDTNATAIQPRVAAYEKATGQSVRVEVLHPQAMATRLMALFMAPGQGGPVPDIVEIEIGSIGSYFRPPADHIGFLPLNDRLLSENWLPRINPARLALWTRDGQVFGIPLDVHPTGILYRDDLFIQAGVDLSASRTWQQFQQNCIAFERYWQKQGTHRYAIELPRSRGDVVLAMLLQQNLNLVDADGRVHFDDARVAKTVAFYAQLAAGESRAGAPRAAGPAQWARALADGSVCAILSADWRLETLRDVAPELAGRVKLMPLPVFEDGDAHTSTWGGTMAAIPRHAPNPDQSWQLLKFLYMDDAALHSRHRATGILPAIDENALTTDDAFLAEGSIAFHTLAGEVPVRTVSPASGIAEAYLSVTVARAVNLMERAGPVAVEAALPGWLATAQNDIHRRAQQGMVQR